MSIAKNWSMALPSGTTFGNSFTTEEGDDILAAIEREKQIKGGSRAKKMALIEANNPGWRDLYYEL